MAITPWQLHHGVHIEDSMGWNHPSFVQIGPLIGEIYSIFNNFKYIGRPPS